MGIPATCEIRDWHIFAPGVHKDTGEYFSPAAVEKIANNFGKYGVVPGLKIGHDRMQRYAASLGFPSPGTIVGIHVDPQTHVMTIDRIVNVPVKLGAAINAGLFPGGSIELAPPNVVRDPEDPSREIDGDVLMGVALLGEELPAVPGFSAPRAVFADGSEVPPLEDTSDFFTAMAQFAGIESEDASDHSSAYASRCIAFSAMEFSV